MGDSYLFIIVNKSHNMSMKEQLSINVRYIDKKKSSYWNTVIKYISLTNTITLKTTLESILDQHSLILYRIRGQDYDWTSNMQWEFNG